MWQPGAADRQPAMHESILSYRRQRYLWVALGLAALCAIAYAWHDPPEPPNGGTWLGYTLGTVGAVLILWLIAFGVRKRSYRSSLGTVQGWLSAHVYLGVSLLAVVTLHTGFQFGWNIHTLAYGLMVVVIASGAFGTVLYLRYPARMNALRTGANRGQWLAEVNDLDQKSLRLARALPPEFAELIASTRDRTVLGGSAVALLAGADRSRVLLPAGTGLVANADQQATLAWLGDRLARSTDGGQGARIQDLLTLQGARRATLARLRDDLRLQAWVEVWLFVHVPVTFALLAALIAHVFSVFIYW
jgi:hypothetical protein